MRLQYKKINEYKIDSEGYITNCTYNYKKKQPFDAKGLLIPEGNHPHRVDFIEQLTFNFYHKTAQFNFSFRFEDDSYIIFSLKKDVIYFEAVIPPPLMTNPLGVTSGYSYKFYIDFLKISNYLNSNLKLNNRTDVDNFIDIINKYWK